MDNSVWRLQNDHVDRPIKIYNKDPWSSPYVRTQIVDVAANGSNVAGGIILILLSEELKILGIHKCLSLSVEEFEYDRLRSFACVTDYVGPSCHGWGASGALPIPSLGYSDKRMAYIDPDCLPRTVVSARLSGSGYRTPGSGIECGAGRKSRKFSTLYQGIGEDTDSECGIGGKTVEVARGADTHAVD
ncbi:uncharacterized protein BT62DRAFT_1002153 [Guyanagaster necrorhizus]|uniref:Uncharacterized protein n=1 Tax=Guyanagaster necrorhizus TaxID=856835 RepID=A0A9P8AVZ2_9AGAR|nr:uncharacterized protein BT62DRAFT_1002153 [Guyanagaster necrorhizus MCA 3950]KAG7449840.1 hypothetical protein BT62DRAFT_1002153 [Guyanagaster necrorhizus MCA 3950]